MPNTNSNFPFSFMEQEALYKSSQQATAGTSGKAWEAFVLHISKSSPWKPSINLKQLQSVRMKKCEILLFMKLVFQIRSLPSLRRVCMFGSSTRGFWELNGCRWMECSLGQNGYTVSNEDLAPSGSHGICKLPVADFKHTVLWMPNYWTFCSLWKVT